MTFKLYSSLQVLGDSRGNQGPAEIWGYDATAGQVRENFFSAYYVIVHRAYMYMFLNLECTDHHCKSSSELPFPLISEQHSFFLTDYLVCWVYDSCDAAPHGIAYRLVAWAWFMLSLLHRCSADYFTLLTLSHMFRRHSLLPSEQWPFAPHPVSIHVR